MLWAACSRTEQALRLELLPTPSLISRGAIPATYIGADKAARVNCVSLRAGQKTTASAPNRACGRADHVRLDIDTDVSLNGARVGTAEIDPLVVSFSYVHRF